MLKEECKVNKGVFSRNFEGHNIKLIPKSEYRQEIRKHLSEDVFKPSKSHLVHYFIGMTICILGIYVISTVDAFYIKLPVSIVMGISLAALTFFLHDLMHGSIASRGVSYFLGLSVGILNFFAPLFWKRVHNFHHAKTGDTDDPDRSYIGTEMPRNIFTKIVYKTRLSNEAINPILSLILMSTGFIWYFGNTMYYGLIEKDNRNKYQSLITLFKPKEKYIVFAELLTIFAFQTWLFLFIFKASILNYYLGSILPVGICHFIAMLYIHTNHFLSPLTGDIDDPLVNSLSIKNSFLVDKIFSNFSHHVEHHLFPAMSSSQYPKVRKILQKLYPERFQLLTMKEAVTSLFKTPRIYNSFSTLAGLNGKQFNCLLPSK